MPSRTITAEQDQVILVLFGQCLQKNVGADGIAVWQHQKAAFTGSRFNGPIGIAIFADMMAWNRRPDALFAPAVFGFIGECKIKCVSSRRDNLHTLFLGRSAVE